MPQCPQCSKPLREVTRRCPSCQADLALLVDYVSHLNGGLERAENLLKAGELGPAVWAYLEVLEVDPDNGPARRQVGQVVTAVRQFDQANEGRRWLKRIRSEAEDNLLLRWRNYILIAGGVFLAFSIGFWLGGLSFEETNGVAPDPEVPQHKDTLSGK
ncbi:MAG: hypothetical protein L0Y72_05335 [Gemmataceae bacterium]|nr:hypothetical protein [Gemmataceae bacterium]MCI0738446.1 hypothetical protein [Gemmataceae bacterium]